jgi:hypothetical protein
MIDHNLGREIKGFNLDDNETVAGSHTVRDHVLNGGGQIKDIRDLALRVLLNNPPTGGNPASAFRSETNAEQSIQTGIRNHVGGIGWPAFRETIIATTGNANAMPGPVAGGGIAGEILQAAVPTPIPIAQLPAYLSGYIYGTAAPVALTAAAGVRPLYPGDPNGGLAGLPLTTDRAISGALRIVMRTQPGPPRGGWFVLTAFPEP